MSATHHHQMISILQPSPFPLCPFLLVSAPSGQIITITCRMGLLTAGRGVPQFGGSEGNSFVFEADGLEVNSLFPLFLFLPLSSVLGVSKEGSESTFSARNSPSPIICLLSLPPSRLCWLYDFHPPKFLPSASTLADPE